MENTVIRVRFNGYTWTARVSGQKKSASCVYSAEVAAKALACKLGLDAEKLQQVEQGASTAMYLAVPGGDVAGG